MVTRYDASGMQAEFEPGSRGRVLRNLLRIRRVRDIQLAESQALQLAQERAVQMFSADHCFSAADICQLHRVWLGRLSIVDGNVQKSHRPDVEERFFQWSVSALAVGNVALRPLSAKGWRMPSIAEDVLAEVHNPFLRVVESRR